MPDIFDQLAQGNTPTTPSAVVASNKPGTPTATKGDIFDQLASGTYKEPSAPTSQEEPGFLHTVGSDLYNLGAGMVKLPFQTASYLLNNPSTKEQQKQLEDAAEQHKHDVYKQVASDFHDGHYWKAVSGLADLFDPKYDDPNDPISKVMDAQWESSKQAKDQMLDAAKKGDSAAVIQHAAGMVPIASFVDNAMDVYQKNPTRQNLAHVVAAAIPAFVPELARKTIPPALDALKETASESIRPVTEEVAGEKIPVRNPSELGKFATKSVSEEIPRKFAVEKTGPAVAKTLGQIAKEAADTEGEIAPTEADRFGVRSVADELKENSKEVFQKLDELSGQKLSEAQERAADYSDDYSGEGRKQYRKALADQDAIFDKFKEEPSLQGKDLDKAKSDWRKANALSDISKKLTNAATERAEGGLLDYQIKQGRQLSDSIDKLIRDDKDTLGRAGFDDDHISQLKRLGKIVEDQANIPRFNVIKNQLASFLLKKGLGGTVGFAVGGPVGSAVGLGAEHLGEIGLKALSNRVLGPILTDSSALETLNTGILSSKVSAHVVASSLAEKIGSRLKSLNLWKDEAGRATIPFTGGNPEADLIGKLKAGDEEAWGKVADNGVQGSKYVRPASKQWNTLNKYFRDNVEPVSGPDQRTMDVADDLTQETFVRAAKSIQNFRGDASLNTWLRSIANKVRLDYYRDQGWMPEDRIAAGEKPRKFEPTEAAMKNPPSAEVKPTPFDEEAEKAAAYDRGHREAGNDYEGTTAESDVLEQATQQSQGSANLSKGAFRGNPEKAAMIKEQLAGRINDPRFAELTNDERQLLIERFVREKSWEQIGKSRGITANGARTRVDRIVSDLRKTGAWMQLQKELKRAS